MIKDFLDHFDSQDLEAVTGMDANFLYGDSATSPMHIGSVAIIQGTLEYDLFKKIIESRIHLIPKFRKRLLKVPFGVDHPYWVDDPDFNLEMHLNHIALPKPGSWKELRKLASRIFSKPLNHSRPLWNIYFVEGLDNVSQVEPGSIAIISKIHHVAIDGMAGAGLLGVLFDMSPEPSKLKKPKKFNPEPVPNDLSLLLKSSASFAKSPLKLPGLIKDTINATIKAGAFTRTTPLDLPTAPFTAPHTPLNGIISSERKWNTSILSLDRVKALKNIMGATLNDVLLAICAGALRKYLLEKDKLPKKPLVSMIPISTRNSNDNSNSGNHLSTMLVQLATDIADPIERLIKIHSNTQRGKTYKGARSVNSLTALAEAVPFGIANQAARMYSRYHLAKLHKPVFNVVVTNVPGPQMPIYLHGHKLHSIMGMAPIIDGMGLIITILSYDGNITISPTSDSSSMPDLDKFSDYILESANELEKHVLAYEKKIKKAGAKSVAIRKAKPVSDKYFEFIRRYLKTNPEFIKKPVGLFQFEVNGNVESNWQLNLSKAPGSVRKTKLGKHDVLFRIKEAHLMKIASKQLDVATAFIQGRISIEGDTALAMKLASILKQLPAYKPK